MRAEQFLPTPPVDPLEAGGQPPQATPAGRGIIDTRIGKPAVFSGDEKTWRDWSFKLRSYASVDDGRSRAGSALNCLGTKCAGESRHGRTAEVQTPVRAAARIVSHLHLLVCFELEPCSLLLGRSPLSWRITRNLDGSANLWWDPMTHNCEKLSLSSFWIQEQPSMSVGVKSSHTLR